MAKDWPIVYSDYAELRMHQRDVRKDEVEQTLAAPPSRHKHRRDGRAEARQRFNNRTLLVVYARSEHTITVINAMWE